MSEPPPVIVRVGGWQRTFPVGHDVVIGRDVRADVRIPHPGVARAHLVLHCRDGQWIAVDDNGSHGLYVDAERVETVPVRGGDTVNLGAPEGPRVTFDLGARPPGQTSSGTPGTVRIGRSPDNDVVVPDTLVSNHHATLVVTSTGARIRRADRFTGTYVNGALVKDTPLREHDVVTVGNVDFAWEAGGLTRIAEPGAQRDGLEVRDVGLTTSAGTELLDQVAFTAAPGTLTAVIGPSRSGRSTLAATVAGRLTPTSGSVSFEGRDLHAEFAAVRDRVALVPQDDVLHRGLTSAQLLGYQAELLMSPDTTAPERDHAVAQVLEELDLTAYADTRVDTLSEGQLERVCIATALLTGPSLFILDEPTSGLDPALDQEVMLLLRRLAAAGRTVVVVTHSLGFLDICDQVVLLAPGGRLAYAGDPATFEAALGSSDLADVFSDLDADPGGTPPRHPPGAPTAARVARPPARLWRQTSTLARRHAVLILANRGYLAFLAALPVLAGLLALTVGGDAGLSGSPAGLQARQILVLMNLGAFFTGTALSVQELVNERRVFLHEKAIGVSATAYVMAKVVVLGGIGVLQSAVLVAIVTTVKGAPPTSSALGDSRLELFVGVAATCMAAAVLGLLVSSMARTANQVLPLTVAVLMGQLVLAGGTISMTGHPLDPLSWLSPSRWGMAATASTADLTAGAPPSQQDPMWGHSPWVWLGDIGMLVLLSTLYTGLTRWRLRRTPRRFRDR